MARFAIDFSAIRETLSNPNFRRFTTGNAVSLLGSWIQRMAVGYLTWDLTHSGTWLGAVAMAEFIPVLFLAPITGVFIDRFDKRKIAVMGQAFALVQAAVLASLTIAGFITPVLIFMLQLFAGVIQPVIQTARLVLVPMMLPRHRVGNAVAITSLIFNTTRILGPAVGGVIITTIGVGWSFAANAVSYFGVITALMSLELPPHVPTQRGRGGFIGEMRAGWSYTLKHPVLGWLIPTVGIASMLTWPIGDLMAGIADEMFQRGAAGLAALTSAQGVGAIMGGLVLAQRPTVEGFGRLIIGAMIMNGLLVAAFSMNHIFWLALVILFVSSFFSVMVGVGSQSLTQSVVNDQMRGRALSVWYTITRSLPAIGALLLGWLSSHFGFEGPLFAAGVITAVAAAINLFLRDLGGPKAGADQSR